MRLWRENQLFDCAGYGGDESNTTDLEHVGTTEISGDVGEGCLARDNEKVHQCHMSS